MTLPCESAPNERWTGLDLRILIGANVISAAGSPPLQILPFLVLSLASEGRVDIAYAGWVGSAYLMGMLSSGLLLPLLKVSRLTRWHALGAVASIILALALSIDSRLLPVLLLLWFVVELPNFRGQRQISPAIVTIQHASFVPAGPGCAKIGFR